MPYKSKAQERLFHYLESKGKMKKSVVDEYDKNTDQEDLPEKMFGGGVIQSDDMNDNEKEKMSDMVWNAKFKIEPNYGKQSGDEESQRRDKEWLRRGEKHVESGYSKGGMVKKQAFAKALYKRR